MFTDFLQLCKRSSYIYFSYVYAEIAFSNVYAEVERADLCHTLSNCFFIIKIIFIILIIYNI